jgi:hypothetical protein
MIGQIYVWNSLDGGWFSAAQRFFTRMPYTHVSGGVGRIFPGQPTEWQLEAKECVTITPLSFGDPRTLVRKWTILNAPEGIIALVTSGTAEHFAGRIYGFFQLLWFIYRWIGESFRIDMRKKKNWFPNGDICSEVWYVALQQYAQILGWKDLEAKLEEWNRDTFCAGDMVTVLSAFPQYFREEK